MIGARLRQPVHDLVHPGDDVLVGVRLPVQQGLHGFGGAGRFRRRLRRPGVRAVRHRQQPLLRRRLRLGVSIVPPDGNGRGRRGAGAVLFLVCRPRLRLGRVAGCTARKPVELNPSSDAAGEPTIRSAAEPAADPAGWRPEPPADQQSEPVDRSRASAPPADPAGAVPPSDLQPDITPSTSPPSTSRPGHPARCRRCPPAAPTPAGPPRRRPGPTARAPAGVPSGTTRPCPTTGPGGTPSSSMIALPSRSGRTRARSSAAAIRAIRSSRSS